MCTRSYKPPQQQPLPPPPGAPVEGASQVLFRNGSRGTEEQVQANTGLDLLVPFSPLLTINADPVVAPNEQDFYHTTTERVRRLGMSRTDRGQRYTTRTTTTFDQAGYEAASLTYQRALSTLGTVPVERDLGDGVRIGMRAGRARG